MELQEIGAMIRSAREELGMSQDQLAQETGIGRSRLSELENGVIQEIGIRKVLLLADRLNLEFAVRGRAQAYTLEDAQRDNQLGMR